jgi:hypothetical protein
MDPRPSRKTRRLPFVVILVTGVVIAAVLALILWSATQIG